MSSSTWMWSKCGPGSEKLEKNKRDLKYDAIHILVTFNEFDSSKLSVLYLNLMVRYMWHEQLIYIIDSFKFPLNIFSVSFIITCIKMNAIYFFWLKDLQGFWLYTTVDMSFYFQILLDVCSISLSPVPKV